MRSSSAADAQAPRIGAGLGLAICRASSEAHGGHILAEHRAGGGSVFRISLPAFGEPPSVPSADAVAP